MSSGIFVFDITSFNRHFKLSLDIGPTVFLMSFLLILVTRFRKIFTETENAESTFAILRRSLLQMLKLIRIPVYLFVFALKINIHILHWIVYREEKLVYASHDNQILSLKFCSISFKILI